MSLPDRSDAPANATTTMPKKKSAVVDAAPPATSHEELGGESHKKKKKKRKRTDSQETEMEEAAHNLTYTSITSSSSGLATPGKKKKKKKKKRKSLDESEVLQTTINGVKEEEEEEEEEEGKTKKKKKRRKSETATEEEEKKEEEEEEEMVVMEEPVPKKKRKKKGKKEEEEEEEMSPKKKEEEKVTPRKEEEEEETPRKRKKEEEEEMSQKKEEKRMTPRKEEEEEESPRKKKKKKKKRQEEEEEEEKKKEEEEEAAAKSEEKKKVKLQSTPPVSTSTTTPTSTKGKKKAKLKEEEVEEKKVEEEEEVHDNDGWTQEETYDLLDRVKEQFRKDKRACRASVGGVDWGAAAPPGHTPDDAREHFMAHYKKINQYKTLTTVVDEVRSLVESGLIIHPKPLLLPYQRFLKKHFTQEQLNEAKERGENFRMGHAAWKNLPEEEREVFIREYKQDRAKARQTTAKGGKKSGKLIKLPKLPHQLYRDDADDSTKGGSRPPYSSLTPSQQLPYIRRSLEEHIRYQADVKAYSAAHPDFSAPPCPAIGKTDLKLYLESHGYPEVPPSRPQTVLYRELLQKGELEDLPGLKKMSEALRRYREMSVQEKLVYRERQAKSVESYEEGLRKFSEGQDEVTHFALKKYQEHIKSHPTKKTTTIKVRPRSTTLETIFPHTAPAVLTQCPKFLGEPPRPVPSAFKLFALKLRATYEDLSGASLQRALREGWKGLTTDEVAVYESRCRLLHKEFEKEVKAYVRQMDPKNRRLYLGFNRYTLYKFFGNRDVFIDDFPNSDEYPVFLKGQKQPPTSPSKPQEEEEEEESEEEETTQKKTTKLSPLQFSSLKLSPSSSPKKPSSSSSSASPSKKKTKAPPPPPPMSDSEEEEEEEEVNVTSGSPIKKNEKKSPATKTKQPPQPQPKSDSETSADEMEIAPAWFSPQVNQPKKKSPATKKTKKQPPQPPPPKSDSDSDDEEEEEEITPAWHSPQVTQPKKQPQKQPPQQKKKKQKDYSSSSSGFSD
ncbi:trichohyalin-like isoform X2 [Eriocheir sinensis]|uniref:trichohyalin-like isoform X2 n=1 Tax=Eriocheir sinensis TaxID=95602 RepID=UPI0021C7A351|nr:trichohyalin-like isoform X2 [Eriocheir sinensis]